MIAIGDIHGHARKLESLLKKTGEEDLIFLGDLIDRGPESNEVIAIVDDLVARGKAQLIHGNHEDLLYYALGLPYSGFRYISAEDNWIKDNHGMTTIKSFGCKGLKDFVPFMQDYIKNVMKSDMFRRKKPLYLLKLTHPDLRPLRNPPGVLLFHASIQIHRYSDEPRDENVIEDNTYYLIWNRHDFLEEPPRNFKGLPFIVHGHTPRGYDPGYIDGIDPPHRANIDGGTYLGGEILAYRLEDGRLYSSGDECKLWALPGFKECRQERLDKAKQSAESRRAAAASRVRIKKDLAAFRRDMGIIDEPKAPAVKAKAAATRDDDDDYDDDD